MKKVIFKDDSVHISELEKGSIIGFVDQYGEKGTVVYVGEDCEKGKPLLSAVILRSDCKRVPNRSCGMHSNNTFSELTVNNIEKGVSLSIREMFVFDDWKQFGKWLSE